PVAPANTDFLPYGVGFVTFWLDRQGPELLLKVLEGQGDLPRSTPSSATTTAKKVLRPPAAVWFSFGDYRPYLKLVRQHGAAGTRVIVQVQTVQEAIDAQQDGVDAIVLQGTESGGHGAQRVRPLLSFIPEVVDALPIFDELREFGWPEGYDGRVIRNLVTDREEEDLRNHGLFEPRGADAFKVLKEDRTGTKEDWKQAVKDQDLDLIPLWAGTGVGLLKKQMSAADWMDQLLGDSDNNSNY
ncbi:hypothetical protein BGX23_002847, partial [Mortierella sp. AD031]